MSSAEYELRRLEDKISDLNQKLEENKRMSKRNDDRKLWELDRLKREFEIRERGYQNKKETLTKDLKDILQRRDRAQFKMNQEKEQELKDSRDAVGHHFNHRIH